MKYRAKIPHIEAQQYLQEEGTDKIREFLGKEHSKVLIENGDKYYIRTGFEQVPMMRLEHTDYVIREFTGKYTVRAAAFFEEKYEENETN